LAFRQLDLSEYDLILTSSSAEAKAVNVRPDAIKITYCHGPSRYYWTDYDSYLGSPGLGRLDPIARIGLKARLGPMRALDRKAAHSGDLLVANSAYIQRQIAQHYGRSSEIVSPPVDTDRFASYGHDPAVRTGFVIAGRQTHYKRFDLAVDACTRLRVPLTVIGNGPEHNRLRRIAGPTVTFLTDVDDTEMPKFFGSARAFLLPGIEDFGITPVEAMAAGTPVIAYRAGGALEYVRPGVTGLFFNTQTVNGLIGVLREFQDLQLDHMRIRQLADRYRLEAFRANMRELIQQQIDLKPGIV
jgi:glycosyltransferase involved in cell wall biosynthesis